MNISKSEKIQTICAIIISEYLKSPHKRLNIKDVAARGKVSRPWLYKYFGSTQEEIILTCIDCAASEFTELSKDLPIIKTKKDWIKVFTLGINQTLKEVESHPDMFRFLIYTQLYPSVYSERCKMHEDYFLEKRFLPLFLKVFKIKPADARSHITVLHSLRMGLISSWLNEENKTENKRLRIIQQIENQLNRIL